MAEIEVTVAGDEIETEDDVDDIVEPEDVGERRRPGRRGQPRRQQQRPRQQRRTQRQARDRSDRQGDGGGRQSNRGRQSRRPDRDRGERPDPRRERQRLEQPTAGDMPEPERRVVHEPEPIEELTPEVRQQLEEVTSEVLGRLIANMQVQVDAYVLDDLRDGSLVFEIEGEDAGLLIGRRGDTLRDLQSIVRLLVGRRLQRRPNIIIDVEQYQDRRRNRLQDLAERAARSATRAGEERMEPMSSDERRLIHLALAEHPNVVTESEGEGDDRHVVVKAR